MQRMQMVLLACGLAAALLAFAPPASATDGVTLINQATALRGLPGCTPAYGSLITICRPGSYRLSGNLSAATGQVGITIRAGKVTLDLNGFTISGFGNLPNGTGTGTGIDVDRGETTISNGIIHGFGAGIVYAGSGIGIDPTYPPELTIRAVTVEALSIGIAASFPTLVEDSVFKISGRGGQGVFIGGGLVTRCTIVVEGTDSFGVVGGAEVAVAENSIRATTPLGVDVTSVGNNVCNGSKC